MSKRYVISSSSFKTKKEALDKIKEWKRTGELRDEHTKVYEISKKFGIDLVLKQEGIH